MESGQAIRLPVAAARGEREEDFPLPAGWAAQVYPPRDRPALTTEDIRRALASPLEADRISVAARGARHAVVLVDDFRRPTPAEPLCLAVIDELEAAGLAREQLSIVLANGAHRPMNKRETRVRLGVALDRVGNVISHDAFSPHVTFLGLTPAGTPVLVNEEAAQADFSVAMSTTYPHPLTAWGGGAKMVLPGISHVSTIHFHHGRVEGGPWAGSPGECTSRRDLEAAAALFELDMSLCAVLNSRRELCGLGVGRPTKAHRRSVALARRMGDTPVTGGPHDLVIANTYPFDADPTQFSKSQAPAAQFGCPMLLIIDFADPCGYHGLYDGPLAPYRRRPRPQPARHTDDLLMQAEVFLYSPQYGDGFVPEDSSWYCDSDWRRLMHAMSRRFPRASVAVLPAAPLQIPKMVG